MLTLFFGNPLAIVSTAFLLAVLGIIIYTAVKHKKIEKWGRRTFILAVVGLILCCLVATRDGLVDTMQGGTGLFSVPRHAKSGMNDTLKAKTRTAETTRINLRDADS